MCQAVYRFVQSGQPSNPPVSQWSGSRPLGHHHDWDFTKTPLRHTAVVPGHGEPVAKVPQGQALNTLQQVTDGTDVRFRVGQSETKDVCPGGS